MNPLSHVSFHGLPAVQFTASNGDQVVATLHGGQLQSWRTADGVERLYLSEKNSFGADAAVRGGVPICFPQFNQRGPLPKHGFARRMVWSLAEQSERGFVLALQEGEGTRAYWPHRFALRLVIELEPKRLQMRLEVENRDSAAWSFTCALHTYLRVEDIDQARLMGLQGLKGWDALSDAHFEENSSELDWMDAHDAGLDRVYVARPSQELVLATGAHRDALRISQSSSFAETVVWNPGQHAGARLADLPPEGWRHFVCIEAANVDTRVQLQPGERWQGDQTLVVLSAI